MPRKTFKHIERERINNHFVAILGWLKAYHWSSSWSSLTYNKKKITFELSHIILIFSFLFILKIFFFRRSVWKIQDENDSVLKILRGLVEKFRKFKNIRLLWKKLNSKICNKLNYLNLNCKEWIKFWTLPSIFLRKEI